MTRGWSSFPWKTRIALVVLIGAAMSHAYGLYYIVPDLWDRTRFAPDTFTVLLEELRPLKIKHLPDDAELYFAKEDAENPDIVGLKLAALQQTFAPRVVRGAIWNVEGVTLDTREELERRGVPLRELHRFSGGGILFCGCESER